MIVSASFLEEENISDQVVACISVSFRLFAMLDLIRVSREITTG